MNKSYYTFVWEIFSHEGNIIDVNSELLTVINTYKKSYP